MKKIIIGKDNATFQQILALKLNRNKRAQTKFFFVEGVQNIKDAISNKWEIEAFVYSKSTNLSMWAKSVINYANVNYILTQNLMEKLSDKEDTSELLAIIRMKNTFKELNSKNPILVLLDRPSKKGNLGTIIRSCDALNVDAIYYSGHSVDIYDHTVITASMGSFFKMSINFLNSNNEFINLIESLKSKYKDLKIIATSLQTENRLQDCDLTKPVLLLIGNESSGLCKFYNDNADTFVKISMREGIDSLNISCATTVSLYEVNRQRNF